MTILEDLKSGRLVVVPSVSVKPLEWSLTAKSDGDWLTTSYAESLVGRYEIHKHTGGYLRVMLQGRRIDYVNAGEGQPAKAAAQADYEARILSALAASSDHTAGLIALVEGMERERDEAAKAFASGAYDDACKREAGIHQHALAFTVEQFRKAEARALAAEAKADALREALEPFGEAGRMAAISGRPPGEHVDANAFSRARALTQEQPNVGE